MDLSFCKKLLPLFEKKKCQKPRDLSDFNEIFSVHLLMNKF